VIGFLDNGYSKRIPELMPAFFGGLAENGFVESRNVIIEYRTAEGDDRVYPAMAEDLVRRGVAVMVTVGGVSATMAAKAATNSIPIVFLVAIDPVASGMVASLNHPGGHLTGVTTLNVEVAPKRLEVLQSFFLRQRHLPSSSIPPIRRIHRRPCEICKSQHKRSDLPSAFCRPAAKVKSIGRSEPSMLTARTDL
jgi:hypothetical protein